MNPNKRIVEAIKNYDSKLFVEWNNQDSLWEVYRQMPIGRKLITPITRNIFQEGDTQTYAPLDYRIVSWLYSADSQRKDLHINWKYRRDIKFNKHMANKKKVFRTKLKHNAQDNYYILNNEMISPDLDETNWKPPEIQGKATKRVMYRKEYYEYEEEQ